MSWNPNDWNPVTLKVVTGCLMALAITTTVCIAILHSIPVNEAVLLEMASFDAAILGISYLAYGKERTTDYSYVEKKGESDAKVAAATSPPVTVGGPSTVTVQPAAIQEGPPHT